RGLTELRRPACAICSGTTTGVVTCATGTLTAGAGSTGLVFAASNGTYAFNGTTTLNGVVNGVTIGTSPGSFTFGSGTAISAATGVGVQINGTQPVVLFQGTITQTTNAQKSVVITGVTGGATGGVASPNSIRFTGNINHTTAPHARDINNTPGAQN